MSKRKPARVSKRSKPARVSKRISSPKVAARAQRSKQAIIKSAKEDLLLSVAAGPIDQPPEDLEQAVATLVQNPPIADDRAAVLRDGVRQMMSGNESMKRSDGSFATYQGRLLEMTYANMRLTFEFCQRLATIRSPFELWDVIAEFTSKRVDLLGKYKTQEPR